MKRREIFAEQLHEFARWKIDRVVGRAAIQTRRYDALKLLILPDSLIVRGRQPIG